MRKHFMKLVETAIDNSEAPAPDPNNLLRFMPEIQVATKRHIAVRAEAATTNVASVVDVPDDAA